jgi:hypothetical protein
MFEAIKSLGRFLRRVLRDIPGAIGTNYGGIWFPILPAALLLAYQSRQYGWKNVKRDLLVGSVVTLIAYGLLTLWVIVRNVYREHVGMQARAEKAEELLECERSRPPWKGYESEAAWRASIAFQNVLIELGRSVDGVLSQLQVDALKLAKDSRTFLTEFEAMPEGIHEMERRMAWRGRLESSYRLKFHDRMQVIEAMFGAQGIPIVPVTARASKSTESGIEKRILRYADALVIASYSLDGVHVKEQANED